MRRRRSSLGALSLLGRPWEKQARKLDMSTSPILSSSSVAYSGYLRSRTMSCSPFRTGCSQRSSPKHAPTPAHSTTPQSSRSSYLSLCPLTSSLPSAVTVRLSGGMTSVSLFPLFRITSFNAPAAGTTTLSPSTHAPPRERPHSHSNAFPDSSTLIQEPTAEADGVPSRTYSDAPLVDTAMSEPSANPNEITPAKRGHKNKKDAPTRGTTFFRGDARRAIEELGEGEYVTMQMLISLPEWWGYRSDQPVYDPPCELCRAGGFSCIQTRNSTCLQCQMRRKRCSIGRPHRILASEGKAPVRFPRPRKGPGRETAR
ncbi:hypothetical protein OF83DRAFT_642169 [Amylostereum chailletii]|nr:hypothetical protein OF83DRAFT_642169 [Amylostereum chailletii]